MGEAPPGRDLLGDRLERPVEPAPRRWAGQLPPRPQLEHGIQHHPPYGGRRAGHDEVDPHRDQPDQATDEHRAPGGGAGEEEPAEQEADGHDQVRSEGERQTGEDAADHPAPPLAARVLEVQPSQHGDPAPQRQGEGAVPGHRGERDGRHHVEDGERGHDGGGQPAPRPGQGEEAEDDAEVLQQAEGALGGQGVADDLVPDHEGLDRSRPVQVQEVHVGHEAPPQQLREVEHEALFHRPARELVEPPERDGHQHEDGGDARPGPQRTIGAAAQASGAAEHEGPAVVPDRRLGRPPAAGRARPSGGLDGGVHEGHNVVVVPGGMGAPGIRSRPRDRSGPGAGGPRGPSPVGAPRLAAAGGRRRGRSPARGGRRGPLRRPVVPGPRPRHDRVPGP